MQRLHAQALKALADFPCAVSVQFGMVFLVVVVVVVVVWCLALSL